MKKKLPASLILPQFFIFRFSLTNLHSKVSSSKVKLSFFFFLFYVSLWAQHPPFNADGTIFVPAGVLTMNVEGWGAGGAGGGASGSSGLVGRSGAGGGGGAHAQAVISVTAGTTLQIKVAPTVAGNTGPGGNGGNSYIQGFESFFLAAGGSGGAANTTGTATGGLGGSASTSKGSVPPIAGSDGGAGSSALLNLLASSGVGGKAGGTGGGAGGVAAGSVLLGAGPGQSGTPPGGGGSGGLHLSGSPAQPGGAGAAGRVNVTYTCPTYGVNSTSALTGACTSLGTATIQLTATAALLPIGVYTVTYNRSIPTGSNLTATMTILAGSAGTGTFVAEGLTTAGTSVITVTNIRSGVCSTNISSLNTANVTVSSPSVGGNVTGGTTICSGAKSGTLTLSGQTGAVTKWQSSVSPFSTWTDIAGTTNLTTYVSGVLTQTTQFKAIVKNGTCDVSESGTTTVTVNPLPQGSLTANGPFCATGAGQLTFTASAGTGPYTVVYNDGTADRTATGVVSGTPFAVFTTPVTGTTTYTLVSVTGANTCVRSTGFTGASATITVNPLPQGSLTANGPFCVTGAGQLTFTASAGTGPFTVVYNDGTANRTVNNVASGTPFNTAVTPVTATTTYTLVSVTGANSCSRTTSFTAGSAVITVNPLPQGSLTANGPFCETGAGQLTFTASAGTGPFTVVYNDGTANRTANNVVSGTPFNTAVTPVTATTTYTLVSVTGANSCSRTTSFTAGSATITVNPLPQGSLTANGPFCETGAGQLTFTASAGTGPFTVVYNDGTANRTVNNVVSGTPFNTAVTPVTATTTYTLVSVTGANSCSRTTSFTVGSATITVNPLPQGSLTANGPFCETGAGQLTFTASAGTGPFTVVYNDGTANRTANNVVSGIPFSTAVTPVTATTTYTLVSVTGTNTCSRTTSFTVGSATITVNPLPQGSLTANGPFCTTGDGQLTFTASAGTGPFTVVYNDGTANRTVNNVVSGTPFNTAVTPVTATTTYTLVSVTGANSCSRTTSFTAGSAVITVNPLPQGSLTANGPFCETGAGQLIFTASAGTGPFTVVYNDGTANRTANNVVSGTPFNTAVTPVTTTTTYTLVSVTGANSCSRTTSFTAGSATITVNPLPQGSLTANGPFCGTGAGQLTFTASAGTGNYTIVYNDGTANRTVNNVVSGTPFAVFTTPVTSTTTYTLVSVTGANSCVRSSGFTGGSATITVTPLPSVPVIGTVTQPTCITPTGSIVLTGLFPTPNSIITQYGTVSQTHTSSGTTFTISNLSPGSYNFTIQEPSGCPSMPTVNVEILAPVTNTWNGTAWSKGSEPVLTDAIRFSGNYSTTGDLNGCSCTVDSGVNVTVNSNHTLTITNAVTNSGGTLTFENNSSLVQTANVVNTGNIIYKRDTKPVRRYDFTHWSTPVKRTPVFTLHDLTPNTLADKYFKLDPVTLWVTIYNGAEEMEPGRGYSVRAPQSYDLDVPSVYNSQFIGVPNNGDILGPPPVADKYNLVGNPYPSALYADRFINDNQANIYGTIYIWTHNTLPKPYNPGNGFYYYSNDDYAIYNLSGSVAIGIPSPNPGNQSTPSGYIASGQGFLVRARTNQRVIFTNAMRVPGENSQFFRTSSAAAIEKHRVWLNLSNKEGAFKQLLLGYITGATNSWDNNFDAVSLDAHPDIDFYSVNNNRKLVIQGRALPFTVSDTIPLGYRSALKGEFTIAIDHTDGNLSDQTIYLQDNMTKKVHNLTTGGYTFTTEIGVFQKRFVLRYTDPNGTLGNEDFTNSERNIAVSVKDKNIKVQSFSDNENLEGVSVYDVSGKLLYDKKGIDNKEWLITNLRSGPQVLLVKITLDNGKNVTRKIIYN